LFFNRARIAAEITLRPSKETIELIIISAKLKTSSGKICLVAFTNFTANIKRIEAALDLLLFPVMLEKYKPFIKNLVSKLIGRYKNIINTVDSDPPKAHFTFWATDPTTKKINALSSVGKALEQLLYRLIRSPIKYSLEHTAPIFGARAPAFPERNRIAEQNTIFSLKTWFQLKSSYKHPKDVESLYESINWFYDQDAIYDLATDARKIISFVIMRYIEALGEYKDIPNNMANFAMKHQSAQYLEHIAHLIACLQDGMHEYRGYYMRKQAVTTLALRI
jgi:hypothetical protein